MSAQLLMRANNACELCSSDTGLVIETVDGAPAGHGDQVVVCGTCSAAMSDPNSVGEHHWRCLTDSVWSQVPAVQVLSAQILHQLTQYPWAQDALDSLYLDDELAAWVAAATTEKVVHKDANGAILQSGDNVTIIKDLNVKGTSFVAKRGTPVRGISLTDNPEHIEGRVNGTRIVILTKYVKKN